MRWVKRKYEKKKRKKEKKEGRKVDGKELFFLMLKIKANTENAKREIKSQTKIW